MQRRTTRLVARVGTGEDWFPRGINEVVSHTDELYFAINVARSIPGRASVVMREFRCEDPARCRVDISEWLRRVAAESEPDADAVWNWSRRIAATVVEGIATS